MVNGVNGDLGMDEGDLDKPVHPVAPEKPVASTRKIRVTYEEYKSISNLLILHLRQVEETSSGKRIQENVTHKIHKTLKPCNNNYCTTATYCIVRNFKVYQYYFTHYHAVQKHSQSLKYIFSANAL